MSDVDYAHHKTEAEIILFLLVSGLILIVVGIVNVVFQFSSFDFLFAGIVFVLAASLLMSRYIWLSR